VEFDDCLGLAGMAPGTVHVLGVLERRAAKECWGQGTGAWSSSASLLRTRSSGIQMTADPCSVGSWAMHLRRAGNAAPPNQPLGLPATRHLPSHARTCSEDVGLATCVVEWIPACVALCARAHE